MKRKILTILLALVMTLISIPCGAAAETATVTDGKLVNIEFTKNADTIANADKSKTVFVLNADGNMIDKDGNVVADTESAKTINVDYAEIDSSWFNGIGQDKLGMYFSGMKKSAFPEDGKVIFNKAYREDVTTDGTTKSSYKTDKNTTYEMQFDLEGFESKQKDAFVLVKNEEQAYNAPSFTAELKKSPSSFIRFAAQINNATLEVAIGYTDGTEDKKSIEMDQHGNVTYHSNLVSKYFALENEEVTAGIIGAFELKNNTALYPWTYKNTYDYASVTDENTASTDIRYNSKGIRYYNPRLMLFQVKPDSSKTASYITISTSSANPVPIYSIAQQELTNAEMMEVVEKAEKIDDGIYSEEDIALIEKASNYAVTLEARNYDYDFSAVKKMAVNAQKQAKIGGTSNIDFSDKFNADTVIEKEGETLNPQTWFAGLEVAYSQYGGVAKFANSEGKIAIKEIVYNTAESKTEETSSSISMDYTEKDGLDSVVLSSKGTKSFKTDLDNVPSSSLFVLTKFEAGGTQKAVVKYSDGTSDTIEYKGKRHAQAIYNDPSDAKSHAAQKDADGNITWVHDNYRIFGYGFTGYDFFKCSTDEEGNSTATKVDSNTIGLHLYELKLDKSKTPVSVTIESDNSGYHVVVYSIAQKKLEYTDMLQALISAESLKVTDENFSYKARQAINYKAFLADCGIISESDYAYVDSFAIQINSEDNNYVDLSNYVDTDLLVASNGTVDSSFNGRLSETWAKDGYYNGGVVPADGILTMSAPTNENSIYGKETGNTFKLSGSYTGMGADAVKVKKGESVTIEIPNALDGYKKGVSVILDFISGEANNQMGIYEADVKVNYTDGTSEDVKVKLFNASLWSGVTIYPHYTENLGRRGIGEDNKFYYSTKSGFNDLYMYSSEVSCNLGKKIKSMTFSNNLNDEYHIFAISEYTYSNYELANADSSALENDITFANKDEIIKAATMALESDRRGITALSEEDKASAENALKNATEFANNASGKIYSKYSVANGSATVALANQGFKMRSFALILASYNADGSLKAINVENVSLNAGVYDIEKQISVSEGDSYMLFVWDSVGGMKPVATEYPY